METINIKATATTPAIKFDPKQGTLEIKGRSISENDTAFYKPVLDNIEQYAAKPNDLTKVDFMLEYISTASSKSILAILKFLEAIQHKGNKVTINWYYEEDDEDMRQAGEDFQTIVNLPFTMQQVQVEE
ncbi:MAG TPA: DUF1987 domain-containing protein [Bacteroidia bacterium]|jgi:hypothetical protein|nr:DUF1987 domain-containing protein [Bacteroidia bacterium]